MSRNAFLAALAATFMLPDPSAHAQGGALERRLASATRVECRFEVLATGDWNGDGASASVTKVDREASFFDIDVDGGTAEADGPFGTAFIVVRYAHGYLHFLQMSDAGPLHVTTVLAQETSGGRLKAVQTRHEYAPVALPGFTSRPEMYIGDCAVT
ncbi:MAG: hypothetical protein LOD94_01185 [Gammaproteobacteria bacterium]|nr:hypothetical protein [Gammaproteobacteria bacterium]